MKYSIYFFSILFLIHVRMPAKENAELLFTLAARATDTLQHTITEDVENIQAQGLLHIMGNLIVQTQALQKVANAFQSYLYKAQPLSAEKITGLVRQNQTNLNDLQNAQNQLRLPFNLPTSLKELNQQIAQAQTATVQDQAALLQNLMKKNALIFSQAVKMYIAAFGKAYTKAGSMYGFTTVIASRHANTMPITPKRYADLMLVLTQGVQTLSNQISVEFTLNDKMTAASLQDVTSYIKNMPVTSTSYAQYAMYGLITVGAIAATIAAINYANNKDLHDTTMVTQAGVKLINDPVGLYNDISASLATSTNQFMNASNETLKNAMNYAQTTSFTDMVNDAEKAATSQLDYVKGLTSALFISFTGTNAIVANNEHVQAAASTPQSSSQNYVAQKPLLIQNRFDTILDDDDNKFLPNAVNSNIEKNINVKVPFQAGLIYYNDKIAGNPDFEYEARVEGADINDIKTGATIAATGSGLYSLASFPTTLKAVKASHNTLTSPSTAILKTEKSALQSYQSAKSAVEETNIQLNTLQKHAINQNPIANQLAQRALSNKLTTEKAQLIHAEKHVQEARKAAEEVRANINTGMLAGAGVLFDLQYQTVPDQSLLTAQSPAMHSHDS